jgi:hypothetical protein
MLAVTYGDIIWLHRLKLLQELINATPLLCCMLVYAIDAPFPSGLLFCTLADLPIGHDRAPALPEIHTESSYSISSRAATSTHGASVCVVSAMAMASGACVQGRRQLEN